MTTTNAPIKRHRQLSLTGQLEHALPLLQIGEIILPVTDPDIPDKEMSYVDYRFKYGGIYPEDEPTTVINAESPCPCISRVFI